LRRSRTEFAKSSSGRGALAISSRNRSADTRLLLGGTITEEEEHDQVLMLRLKNRPLDQDYKPHSPGDSGSSEAGSYWVMVSKKQVRPKFRNWARATVVGRVTGEQRYQTEPVLTLLYIRGWGASGDHAGLWENIDPNYVPSVPGNIDRN